MFKTAVGTGIYSVIGLKGGLFMNPKSLGLAGGFLHGIIVFVLTLLAMTVGIGSKTLGILIDMCPMFSISLSGAIIGFSYAFIIGYALFYMLATLYHFFEG
jgi:hypothetical protein